MSPSIERAVIDAATPIRDPGLIRTLVHKRFSENVLLTGVRACAADRFICTGRMPTAHALFNDNGRNPRRDILFYTEVGRQASLAVTHAFLNVGLGEVFIFERSEASLTDAIWQLPPSAATVAIEIRIREAVRRKGAVSRVIADHSMAVDGEHVFNGTGQWTVQSAAIFKRLRRGSTEAIAPGFPPSDAFPASNCVIMPLSTSGAGVLSTSLVIDTTHPFFFDHACDHVPGMLLLEGFAQMALGACASSGSAPGAMAVMAYEADFSQFVECNLPASLTARVNEAGPGAGFSLGIEVAQQDAIVGSARLRVGLRG